jgi:DNA modification methylase
MRRNRPRSSEGQSLRATPLARRLKRGPDGARKTNLEDPALCWAVELRCDRHPERTGHPTQKPRALMEWIVKACSNEGDLVLDCLCGLGTTARDRIAGAPVDHRR